MTAPAPAPRKANTQFGQPLWFAGYASGDLLTSTPTLLKDRFIYVIEKRSNAPARLHMELHTSPDGELWAGPPDRRFRERDPQNRDLYPVMSPVPWTVEGNGNTHFFFASPTRLLKRAIAALESAVMTPDFAADWVDFWQHPLPRGRFFNPPGHPPVLVVTDPLTIGAKLQSDYEQALNDQLKYMMPPRKDKSAEADTIRSRLLKYQLAQLINHYLLPGGRDPYHIRREFKDAMGDNLRNYIEGFDNKVQSLADQVDATAARLIEHLQSPAWNLLAQLHSYCKEDRADWLELSSHCFERLGSSERGAKFTGDLYHKPPRWLDATGITGSPLPPEGGAEDEEALTFIARKAAAGIATFWAEVLPNAVALGKTSLADALDKVDKVYRTVNHLHVSFWEVETPRAEAFVLTVEEWVTKKPVNTHAQHAMHEKMTGVKEWLEGGEAKWPEESNGARTARGLNNLNRAIQLLNLAAKLKDAFDPNKGSRFDSGCEVAVAILDTVEAFEHTLEPLLKKIAPEKYVGASFKFMGSAAGFVHVALTIHKIREAEREGKRDLLTGYKVELGIFLAEGIGGAGQGVLALTGSESAIVLALDVVASALCFASATAAVVYALYDEGQKKNVFQRFVNHSAFGRQDDKRAEAIWASGRSFSVWKNEPTGLRRQRETLTMLFANFSVIAENTYSVKIRFGATPPGMKLKVTFTHGDQEFPSSPAHLPEVRAHIVLDPFLKEKDREHALDRADGDVIWEFWFLKEEPGSIHLGCRPKARRHQESSTQYCYCDAQLVFESERPGQSEVAVPPETPLHYVTMTGSARVSRTEKSSLPEPD